MEAGIKENILNRFRISSRSLSGFGFRIFMPVVVGLLLALSSCFKEKPLAPPSKVGIGQTAVIEMGPDYLTQFFYSLETNKVVSSNSRFAYDMMFDCAGGKFNIWLNTAKFMSAVRTNRSDLNGTTILDTAGRNFHYETGAYNVDSSALGQWWVSTSHPPVSAGKVYIINLGVDQLGNPYGFIKFKVNNFYGNSYSVTYSDFSQTDSTTILVPKDATRNYRYLSLTSTGTILDNIEPDKSTWDLCFTHYTILFYQPYYLPYQVTGVLTNPSRVQAYVDSTLDFSKVTISDFNVNKLQTNRDAVGYDWKTYTGNSHYTAKDYFTYFIKTDENQFYKLHFLGFDNNNGVKGYPSFEYSQL